jgi:selenocysteine-specific elongation factor
MRVIGTAGHVDHGKSTLVQALTGIHPDRLKEEREREMTIDLGFAWVTLPNGEEIGVVDVPGHRDFIENMLAGVGGIDAALFVVAADEGVMPQTREHLAILDLLQIPAGVVALTKVDLIEDEDWLQLVEDDLRQALRGTILSHAPIVRVSARSGRGLDDLRRAIIASLQASPPRLDFGRPRLPIDRVFTMAGFGTVVTGTLLDGSLQAGDEVEIYPRGLRGRVRGLQTHKRKESRAIPGARTAVNISGVPVEEVERGDVLGLPGAYQPTQRLDARFRLLADVSLPLKHNTQVKFFLGAAEVVARLRLLDAELLDPGGEGWIQLELAYPVVARRGDRYILRRPSPGETLGGGVVVDAHPARRHKRFNLDLVGRLEALVGGSPEDIIRQTLAALGAAPAREVIARSGLDAAVAAQAIQDLAAAREALDVDGRPLSPLVPPDALLAGMAYWDQLSRQALGEVASYHQANPLRKGMPREELKSRLKNLARSGYTPRLVQAALRRLVEAGQLTEAGPLVNLPGHIIRFDAQQEQAAQRLLARFTAAPYSPPSLKECQSEAGEELVNALVELGRLTPAGAEVLFETGVYQQMVAEIRALIQQSGPISAAQVRDRFNTSRRYALALLEHLDSLGVTVRDGDARRLKDAG